MNVSDKPEDDALPPGPWRPVGYYANRQPLDGDLNRIVDANGEEVIGMQHEDGGELVMSPAVLAAILDIPLRHAMNPGDAVTGVEQ